MRLIIMFIAIALAAGAFFITMHFTSSPNKEQQMPVVEPKMEAQEVPTVDIYTAKQDIPIGTVITQEMLDLHPWPKNLLLADMVIADQSHVSEILKMIARTPFQKGEPIILNKLANENDPSFLASSLDAGMRLITVAVDAVSGAGGFVFPGDRVDVLVTHDVPTGEFVDPTAVKKEEIKKPVTEVLVSDVRVLATNQKSTAHGGDVPVIPTTVSLEVDPESAQKIRLADNGNGHLSLVLRSLKDKNNNPVTPSGLGSLSSSKTVQDSVNGEVTIIRGVRAESVEVLKP